MKSIDKRPARADQRITDDFTKRFIAAGRHVAVRETAESVILSNGNSIKSFTREQVQKAGDDGAMPLTMALYDNMAPPAPPSMIKPIAAYIVNSFSVEYNQRVTEAIRSHEKIIIDETMWRTVSGAGPIDGWKSLRMSPPMMTPVSVRLGAILLEPIKSLLGQQGSGDVRYDGVNGDSTMLQTAVARRTTEIIEIPDMARSEPTRLDIRRSGYFEGQLTASSYISMPRTEDRILMTTPSGRTATVFSVPAGVRKSGLLQAIIAQCEARLQARRPGSPVTAMTVRFGYPQPEKYGVVRYVAVRNFGAKITDGALREMSAADIDHPVERSFFYLPASTF